MKNKKTLLVASLVFGLSGIGMLLSSQGMGSFAPAQLLDETAQTQSDSDVSEAEKILIQEIQGELARPDLLTVATQQFAPESPDFLNTFNLFRFVKSETALKALLEDHIQGEISRIHIEYLPEILSYVYRLAGSEYVKNKLPMWPEYNRATMGNVLAYLFPQEPNPLLLAKAMQLVPEDAQSKSYLSKAELVIMLSKLFMDRDQDPFELLAQSGFIDEANEWRSGSKEGFLLVDAVRITLRIREAIERHNIQSSKLQYEQQLVDLKQGQVVISDESLKAMMTAFASELRSEQGAPRFPERVERKIKGRFAAQYGELMTADNVTVARELFFKEMGAEAPAVYELPRLMTAGSCASELFRKTYMGAVVATGPYGTSIICDQIMVQFPANSYLLNIHSLPKVAAFEDPDAAGNYLVRTDALRSYKNALILTPYGEAGVTVVYRPADLEEKIGQAFEFGLKDRATDEITSLAGVYTKIGAEVSIALRNFSGDLNLLFKNIPE